MNFRKNKSPFAKILTSVAFVLFLISNSIPVAATTVERRIVASKDDAEEGSRGSVSTTSSDLELVFDISNQIIGMRFIDLTIPQGATIDQAYIQFEVDETSSVFTSLSIYGEDTDSAKAYVTIRNNISSRPATTAAVNWQPQPWFSADGQGPKQRTPDISAVVQEIVNHPNWNDGNALAVMISGTGERIAKSYNGSPNSAPLLHVEYTVGPPVNKSPVVEGGANKIIVLSDSFVSLDDASVIDDGLPSATLGIEWTVDSATVAGDVTFNPSISVQNPTVTFPASGTYVLRLTANDDELENSDTVTVTVKPEGTETISIDKRVAASEDDAEEQEDGGVLLFSADLEMVSDKGGNQMVGMRFTGLDIPKGALIEKASIQFRTDEINSGDTSLLIHGESTGSAGDFTSSTNDISSRTVTSASISWEPPDWNIVNAQGMDQQTADISPIVQEIVNRPDWYNGNALAIIISGIGERTAGAFDGSQSTAPLLHVEYSGGSVDSSIRSWSELEITLDHFGIGVDTANKRLFVPLGSGFATPKNYSASLHYFDGYEGYALKFDNGPLVGNGDTLDFAAIEYGSKVPVQLYQDDELLDSYTLVFNNLPMVELSANSIVDEPKLPGMFRMDSGEFLQDTGVRDMGIEIRGSTSQIYPKKSFSLELRKNGDPNADEKKIKLLGMRKDGDWLLDAAYRDTAFVRNIVSHDIYNDMRSYAHIDSRGKERGQAAIRGNQVEVILNEQYQGLYILEEKVDRKLLNLEKIDVPEDELGNKLWDQVDFSDPANGSVLYKAGANEANLYQLDVSINFEQKYPKDSDITHWGPLEELAQFIITATDEEFINNIGDIFDIDSAVDYWLLTQITGNRDTLKKNYYLARNASEQWFFIPWDYDASFGMYWNGSPYTIDNWWNPEKNNLIRRLSELTETGFNTKVKLRWNELRTTIFTEEALIARFINYREKTVPVPNKQENARTRNFERWPESGGEGVDYPELGTIEYIQDWIRRRIEFLDVQILSQPE